MKIAGGMPGDELSASAAESIFGIGHSGKAIAFNVAFDADGLVVYGGKASGNFIAFFRKDIEYATCLQKGIVGHFTIGGSGLSAPVAIGPIGEFGDRFGCAAVFAAAVCAGQEIIGDFEVFFGFEADQFGVERRVGEEDFAGSGDRSAIQNYGSSGRYCGAAVSSEGACVGRETVVGHDGIGVDLLQGQGVAHSDGASPLIGVDSTGGRSSHGSSHRGSSHRGRLDGKESGDRQEENLFFHDVF